MKYTNKIQIFGLYVVHAVGGDQPIRINKLPPSLRNWQHSFDEGVCHYGADDA